MAEGVVGEILGEEPERPEADSSSTAAGAEAFASAIAAIASRQDPAVARRTEEFLAEQTQLLKVQKHHLEAEHALRLKHLHHQSHLLRGQRVGQSLRIAVQFFFILAGTVIGIGVAVLLHDAITSHRLVIESFTTAPPLVERGISGSVIGSGILDEINRLQTATHSTVAAKRDLSNVWTGDVKLEVPETGISLGEVSRLLRERFGDDLYIGGDAVMSPDGGLTLTIRGTAIPARSFSGSAADLDKLEIAAAQYAFAQAQPVLWATYLSVPGHYQEVISFVRTRVAGAAPADRPYLLNLWGLALQSTGGSQEEAIKIFQAALALKPDLWTTAHINLQGALAALAREEDAWRAGEGMRAAAGGRPGRAPEEAYLEWDALTWNLQASLRAVSGNSDQLRGYSSTVNPPGPATADLYARLHDTSAAELAADSTVVNDDDPTIAAGLHFARGELALEAHDAPAALREMEAFQLAYNDPAVKYAYAGYNCWVALAEELAGHSKQADAVLDSAGTYVDCGRFRGDILDGRGDWPGAQKAYGAAIALAPDLPAAYFSWGAALARHHQNAAAKAQFQKANERGPHWADPLKAWGDVLASEGRRTEALAKYTEALNYAPQWPALREASAKLQASGHAPQT